MTLSYNVQFHVWLTGDAKRQRRYERTLQLLAEDRSHADVEKQVLTQKRKLSLNI
jgi:hypothetical protein